MKLTCSAQRLNSSTRELPVLLTTSSNKCCESLPAANVIHLCPCILSYCAFEAVNAATTSLEASDIASFCSAIFFPKVPCPLKASRQADSPNWYQILVAVCTSAGRVWYGRCCVTAVDHCTELQMIKSFCCRVSTGMTLK